MNIERRIQVLEARPLARVVPPEPVALDTPADVLAVLGEQINAVRSDAFVDPEEKARTLGMLASVTLRAMEAKDLDARLEAVERVLKLRRDSQEANQKRGRRGW